MGLDTVPLFEYDYTIHNPPERTLITAVLERAVRDLGVHVGRIERRDAIAWFRAAPIKSKKKFYLFTFQQIIEELGFNSTQIEILENMVIEAEKYQRSLKDPEAPPNTYNFKLRYRKRTWTGCTF